MGELPEEMILREFISDDVIWRVKIYADVDNVKKVVYISMIKEYIYLIGDGGNFGIISKKNIFLNDEAEKKRTKFVNEWLEWCKVNNYKLENVQ